MSRTDRACPGQVGPGQVLAITGYADTFGVDLDEYFDNLFTTTLRRLGDPA